MDLAGIWWVFVLIVLLFILVLLVICCICSQRNRGDSYDVDEKERKMGNNPEEEIVANGYQEFQRA